MTSKRWTDLQGLYLAKRVKRNVLKNNLLRCVVEVLSAHRSSDRIAFQRLTQWFANRATVTNLPRHNILAWLPLLQQLHQIRNPRPRRRTTVQQFMRDHADTVNAAFVSKYTDSRNFSSPQRMNLRYDLAKSMLSRRYSHLVAGLDEKAVTEHKASMEEWEVVLQDISLAEDVSQWVLFLFSDFVDSCLHAQDS